MGISILQFMPHNRQIPPLPLSRSLHLPALPLLCDLLFQFHLTHFSHKFHGKYLDLLLLGAQHRQTFFIERPFTPLHKVDTPLSPLSLSPLSPVCVCVWVNNERPRAVFLLCLSSISEHKKLIILHHFYACV